MRTNPRRIVIDWGDYNPAGIVVFPRCFAFFDACTWALFTPALGTRKPEPINHHGRGAHPSLRARSAQGAS
jgi:4-hydroxybenzoyl-CoA thioesterase